ncbi:MAG: helix-turn-helix domain-containing protein [Pseudomonadota bacterium]
MKQLYSQVVILAKAGNPPKQIATWVNASQQTVYYYIRKARKAGEDIPYFDTAGNVKGLCQTSPVAAPVPIVSHHDHIAVPLRLKGLLNQEAERRGKTPAEVARDILEKGLLGSVGP